MTTRIQECYEPLVSPARDMVMRSPIVKRMLSPMAERDVLERFLIEYCSLGVQLTEPVEQWIARAGERCIELGLEEVGACLRAHAKHEADHHYMFIEDTQKLVARHNTRCGARLSATDLIGRPPTPAMQRYIDLHESTIAGNLPAAQVAIELEIERLSVVLVPALLAQWTRVLGPETVASLTFLGSHAQLDVGHTHLNTRLMEKLLSARPGVVDQLAQIGAESLRIYMAIFEECWQAAESANRRDGETINRAQA